MTVHRLLQSGPLRFNKLSDDVGPITNNVLSNSLKDLQVKVIVERTAVSDQSVEVEYALTEHCQSLESVIEVLEGWGENHFRPTYSQAE